MAICMYNGKRIIPAPLVSISKEYQTTDDGTKIGALFNIVLNGYLFSYKGSPQTDGTLYTGSYYPPDARTSPTYIDTAIDYNEKFTQILRKQESIRALFAEDGKQFELQGFDGAAALKCNPRVLSIEFTEDKWVDVCPYRITLEAVEMTNVYNSGFEDTFSALDDGEKISSAAETWDITTEENPVNTTNPRTYTITHTLSAKGLTFYNNAGAIEQPAWKHARDFVVARLGLDNDYLTSLCVKDLSGTAYNHIRTETIDELGGTYSATETWIVSADSATETFEITTTKSGGRTTVSISGQIQGFESRTANMTLSTSKYSNASTKWAAISGDLFSRAQTYSGVTLNTTPINITKGENPAAGTITYTYEYDNRRSNSFTGSISEVISVVDSYGVNVFAAIPVLGREAGPVFQDIGTKREKVRNLSVELVMDGEGLQGYTIAQLIAYDPFTTQAAALQAIVDSLRPTSDNVFVSNQTQSWDISELRATYSVEWTHGD